MARSTAALVCAALVCAALALLALPRPARADYEVRLPEAEEGEWELEDNGSASFDHNPAKSGTANATVEIGYGVNAWYHTELELDYGRNQGPGQPIVFQGVTWENLVQLTETGEYWANLGFYAEASQAATRATPDDILFGPLISKDIGRTTQTLNLFLLQEFGPAQTEHSPDLSYAWQSRWNLLPYASPAIEIYGDVGPINHIPTVGGEQLQAGPVLLGGVSLGSVGNLNYQVGYLAGLTAATPRYTVKWGFEWEIRF
jgi:hypothetical protein